VRCGLEHLAEEAFGGPRVSIRAQHEIDRLSRRIDGAVKKLPLTFDFDVGLIDAVGVARQSQVWYSTGACPNVVWFDLVYQH
jgi:hypothetical protein